MLDRLWKNITASKSSWLFMGILLLGLLSLCAIEVRSCTAEVVLPVEASEEVDAAGLDANNSAEGVSKNNSINTAQLPDSSFIYDISIEEITNADSYLDGQTVQVVGEVVGDRISAEESNRCWITLQSEDGTDSEVSIYMPKTLSEKIDTYGAYGKRGTQLQVRGTFHLACRDHYGASDIHADTVAVVMKGQVEEMPFEPRRLVPGILLIMAGCGLMLLHNVLRERQR